VFEAARQENVEKCVIAGTICVSQVHPCPIQGREPLECLRRRPMPLRSSKSAPCPITGIPGGVRFQFHLSSASQSQWSFFRDHGDETLIHHHRIPLQNHRNAHPYVFRPHRYPRQPLTQEIQAWRTAGAVPYVPRYGSQFIQSMARFMPQCNKRRGSWVLKYMFTGVM